MNADSEYPAAHAFTGSYGFERVIHVTEDHFLIRNQLHSRIAHSKPLIHRENLPTEVGFISASTYVNCNINNKVDFIRRGKKQKLVLKDNTDIVLDPELCLVGTDVPKKEGTEVLKDLQLFIKGSV